MNSFSYVTAQTPESAVALAGRTGRFLAGGIDLLGEVKERLVEPEVLVNIKSLPGTTDIAVEAERCVVGAGVKLAALAAHDDIRRLLPGLVQAVEDVGSPQMRNVATVGGNLAQHSRCWYYRHRDVTCLKKGGSRCYAREGENKFHALFSGNPCLSPLVSNLAVALAVLDARVEVQRGRKVETLPLADLYRAAWDSPRAHHGLRPADLILRVVVPVEAGRRSVYLQMGEKSGFDWALVSCAGSARLEGGRLYGVRLALGVVAPMPWRVPEAEKLLEGQPLTDELAGRVAEAMLRGAQPRAYNAYKVPLAQALVRRTLARLVG